MSSHWLLTGHVADFEIFSSDPRKTFWSDLKAYPCGTLYGGVPRVEPFAFDPRAGILPS